MTGWTKGEWIKGVAHWREGDRAFISISFTWRLPEARKIAEYYRSLGCTVQAGGKTWYNVFRYGYNNQVEEFVTKNCKAIAESRNANIAKKLDGVTEVLSTEVAYSRDGFNGTFKVNTNKGVKTVTIQTIYAGGYNIQCFHQRTLVKVK